MDSTKTAIKSLVLDLRKSLEADIEVGLRRYGITPTTLRPLDTLKHLNDRELSARIRMEEALRHELGRDETTDDLADAVHWFVREVAFTHLNRLVGLKALEVRGLAPESIQTRSEYGNRSRALRDYRSEHPEAASLPDDGLEQAIQHVCRQIYPEFRLLFDVGDPAEMRDAPVNSLLWPSTPTLKTCIAKINELDEKIERSGPPAHDKATPEQSVWAEDEIIGWIYQFYNAEEKVSIRKKGKPTHPAEVAVINQFFTPRWIVKFLVDNTLGRLWLEMHPYSPRVRERCDYLVPEPLAGTENSQTDGQIQLDPDSPINNPDAEPCRAAKRPQDIRLIDPACGTMHFGHYAFEVFQAIYADAREQGWVSGSDALSDAQLPAAILENNLFGVDIDLRAVQLAALSLFMKAKSANPDAHVGQVNLIVADAHLPRGKVRQDFLAQYASEPVIQQAFQEVFESLDNIADVGSLLQVEERFRQVLAAAGYQSKTPITKKGPQQAGFAEIAPGWSLEHTVDQMLDHLRLFARRALQEHDLNAQIFAAETEKSVALLDVLLHEYDVVVMNPPYGQALDWELIPNADSANRNLYGAFLLRAKQLAPNGYTGALTDRTFLLLYSFEKLRTTLLENQPIKVGIDLGWEVLDDANVATVAAVYSPNVKTKDQPSIYISCLDTDEKKERLKKGLSDLHEQKRNENTYVVDLSDFWVIPTHPFCYWVPDKIREAFKKLDKFEPRIGIARKGISPGDTPRFIRKHWEVSKEKREKGEWLPYANGGSYSPYYRDNSSVILWENNGEAIKELKPKSVIRSEKLYGKSGLTFASRHQFLNVQFLEAGHIFSNEGFYVECKPNFSEIQLAALLNSALLVFMTNLMAGLHKQVSHIKNLPFSVIGLESTNGSLQLAKKIFEIKKTWDTGNESSTQFIQPWLLQEKNSLHPLFAQNGDNESEGIQLRKSINHLLIAEQEYDQELQECQERIDEEVYELYDVTAQDKQLVERETSNRAIEAVWLYGKNLSRNQKATEHVARLMSYCLLNAIQDDPDGILPLMESSGQASVLHQVQTELETHFGESAAYQVELDSADYLGRPLGEWLLKTFWKDYHVKWYENRPVLWQLQSQKGHFACLVYIHKMDRDTLPKVRSQYLWASRNACQAALESARLREDSGDKGAAREVADLESMLDDLNDFERRLSDVIEARIPCDIPDWAQGPYRNGAYDPVLDDGVKVNILPLQEAGLLAKNKVV
jgi:hypothetical protein